MASTSFIRRALLVATVFAAGCSPAFNWREVRPDNTRLLVLLPCKPDKVEKVVPLGGQPTPLAMVGCSTGGATFAVAVADIGDASRAANVLSQWQALTLANMKAAPASESSPLKVPNAAGTPVALFPVLLHGRGQQADGQPVEGWMAYFAQGSQLFQVVVYANKLPAGVADTFFASLKLE